MTEKNRAPGTKNRAPDIEVTHGHKWSDVRAAYATPADQDYADLTEDWDQTSLDGLEAEGDR